MEESADDGTGLCSCPDTTAPVGELWPCPQDDLVTDDLVAQAPGWVLPVGMVGLGALLVTCFLVFWRGMGTAPRPSAVEAFGVAFSLLVIVSTIGAFRQAAVQDRAAPDATAPEDAVPELVTPAPTDRRVADR